MDPGAAFKAFEAQGWCAAADTYDLVMGPLTARTHGPLLDAARVGPGSDVLDVATGTGALVAAAARRGASAVGVDVAPAMLANARARHPGLRFVAGDAEALPFADASFDAVVAAFVLNHLPHPERAAREMARVLRPGGRVAACVWDVPARNPFLGLLGQALDEAGIASDAGIPDDPGGTLFADDAAFARLLTDAGLAEARVADLALTHVAAAGTLWEGLLGGTVRAAARAGAATPTQRAAARSALARLAAAHATEDGVALRAQIKLAGARVMSAGGG